MKKKSIETDECYKEIKQIIIYFNHEQTNKNLSMDADLIIYDYDTPEKTINIIDQINPGPYDPANYKAFFHKLEIENVLKQLYDNREKIEENQYKSFISYDVLDLSRYSVITENRKRIYTSKLSYHDFTSFNIDDDGYGNEKLNVSLENIFKYISKLIVTLFDKHKNLPTNETRSYIHFQCLLSKISEYFLYSKRSVSGKHGLLRTLKKLVNCVRGEQIYSPKQINDDNERDGDSTYITLNGGRKQTRRRKKKQTRRRYTRKSKLFL